MSRYIKNSPGIAQNLTSVINKATLNKKPRVELTPEQKQQLKNIANITLSIIAAAGVITIASVAPNVLQAIDAVYKFTKKTKPTFKQKQLKTAKSFYYLKRHGLIQIKPSSGGLIATLTSKGKSRMLKLNFETLQISKQPKWDCKWWLVAADIPTKEYRWAADLFRQKIKQLRFYPLQRTMWFYPYNPSKEIEFLAQHYDIGQFVTVMEVSKMDIDDEQKLKKYFDL